ncbi:unnamed protein product [Adineta steineri]|uniref:Uncharacterized protein n=1 Tax=Adineta steineri TaxID=433720 RepID=A0A813TK58_9BILA|nr:unnamed protein product [Adineta steineri]CAF0810530.1 unnamed protein product [Adineta steineri]
MPIKMCSSSSTSTTDLQQCQVICSDSYSQTSLNDDDDDDDYANYEEIYCQKSLITTHENNIKKSDQTTLCRINRYSIACWTKPAYLITN